MFLVGTMMMMMLCSLYRKWDFLTISIWRCLCVRSSVSCHSNVYLRSRNSPVVCCETERQLLCSWVHRCCCNFQPWNTETVCSSRKRICTGQKIFKKVFVVSICTQHLKIRRLLIPYLFIFFNFWLSYEFFLKQSWMFWIDEFWSLKVRKNRVRGFFPTYALHHEGVCRAWR